VELVSFQRTFFLGEELSTAGGVRVEDMAGATLSCRANNEASQSQTRRNSPLFPDPELWKNTIHRSQTIKLDI
jgi:hypothetical protein